MRANRWSGHTALQRFWMKVELEPGGCWRWTGGLTGSGYGQFPGPWGKQAHKFAYEAFIGPVPAGLDLDHFECERRDCVNPNHVRPATRRENLLRGDTIPARNASKESCPKGHPYTSENTRVRRWADGRVGRECITCYPRKS